MGNLMYIYVDLWSFWPTEKVFTSDSFFMNYNLHKPQKNQETFLMYNHIINSKERGKENWTERDRESVGGGGGRFSPSPGVSGLSLPLCGSSASGFGCLTGTWPGQTQNHKTARQHGMSTFPSSFSNGNKAQRGFEQLWQGSASTISSFLTSFRFLFSKSLFLSRKPEWDKQIYANLSWRNQQVEGFLNNCCLLQRN